MLNNFKETRYLFRNASFILDREKKPSSCRNNFVNIKEYEIINI